MKKNDKVKKSVVIEDLEMPKEGFIDLRIQADGYAYAVGCTGPCDKFKAYGIEETEVI